MNCSRVGVTQETPFKEASVISRPPENTGICICVCICVRDISAYSYVTESSSQRHR